ncbi:MAG: beta-propeller domain-containing protein [Proteobacteria bacterium]|nr:beta-propeller domain-containing protein [Pseudomonadota bacterium]
MLRPLIIATLIAAGLAGSPPPAAAAGRSLHAFASDAELKALFAKWQKAGGSQRAMMVGDAMPVAAPPPAAPAPAKAAAETAAPAAGAASITNVQTQGVDEGDIVKQYGDYLIVLRRGRLFTVRVGGDALQPVSAVNAYAPDVDPGGTWYDEMLIADGRIVVIGYSYARGGTEIGLFDLDGKGGIHYRATYQMRSSDYYSARNYASRLIGHQLIFYAPTPIDFYGGDPMARLPALRHWHAGATPADFQRILPATRIYRSSAELTPDDGITLHTVSVCDLDATPMRCKASAVLGPSGRVFYVSPDSVFVWTTSWRNADVGNSSVFRIPLDGSAPTGLRTTGSPIDQMSFLQQGGWLNVLLNRDGRGNGMWAANGKVGAMALLRVPLAKFGDGSQIAGADAYRLLPDAGTQWNLQNRYIGDWLLYGANSAQTLHALRYAGSAEPVELKLPHPVERIDAIGSDGIVVGREGNALDFTSIALGRSARIASTFRQPDAAQGDRRTHGYFYHPDGTNQGIIGLPIVQGGDRGAAVLFLRNMALRLSRMGRLDANAGNRDDDACKASCVDWYGNARPIFLGSRVFALLGYELVEGRIDGGRIGERRRADFAPKRSVQWAP